ncbi:MAG: phage tail protein [Candidatus Pristimantibacillus sp.]
MIGSFGSIVFTASRNKTMTFNDFKRTTSARWATHDVHLKNPIVEYLGPGQDTITFSMIFDVSFGVRPRNEMTKILKKCRDGVPHKLIIGGVPEGGKQWVIESFDQTWERFDGRGNLLRGGCTVTMKEYG